MDINQLAQHPVQTAPATPQQVQPVQPTQQQTQQTPSPTQTGVGLDPQTVNLTKAIRQVESGGNYKAKGGSGEHGAYQWMPGTWNADSQKYLGQAVPLEQSTPEQQNEVAYKKIADWKAAGFNVGQIASMWNAGGGHPDAYLQNHAGVNAQGVSYNTPAYAEKVAKAYQQFKANDPGFNSQPYSNPTSNTPTPDSGNNNYAPDKTGFFGKVGQQIVSRTNDFADAVNNGITGKINPVSGILQAGGAIGGAIGDATNDALELVPGVKWLEGKLGQGVQGLAKTQTGQAVVSKLTEFSQQHPELSADIGAGFNIATAIPILKGLGVVKEIGADSVAQALKGIAEKSATADLTEIAGRTAGGRSVMSAVPDAVDNMVKNRTLPDIVAGKYSTGEALAKNQSLISAIDENELQPKLQEISAKQNFGQNLDSLKKIAIDEAKNDSTLKEAGVVPQAIKQIENRFNGWKYSYGDKVDLATENRLKIGSGKFTDWGSPEGAADKSIYHALQHNIEQVATKHGYDLGDINKRMASLINTQKLFKYIDGKAVKNGGLIHTLIKSAATVGGEAAGNAVGVPIAGALVGSRATGLIEKTLGRFAPKAIVSNVLKRTAPDAISAIGKAGTVGKAVRATGGLLGQQLLNPKTDKPRP